MEISKIGAEESVQWLKVLAALTDQGSIKFPVSM